MLNKIILASKSKVRKDILDKHNIPNQVVPSNVDEDEVKRRSCVWVLSLPESL